MNYRWKPPKSPVGMLQEDLWPDEWKVLVACLLHNQTSRKQVDKVYKQLFTKYPDATSMMASDVHELQDLIKPLGMWKKRSQTLQRFSRDYLMKDWQTPKELYGCGKYADDVWRVFIRGDWKSVVPNDRALNRYHDFLKQRSKNA